MELEKIRLLIVEDQPAVRRILHVRLAAEEDIYVVGEAFDCETALRMATTFCPDIVLVDIDIPGSDGILIASELHQICPNAAVIVLSIHIDALTCEQVKRVGAAALVDKSLPTDTLLDAIRQVASR